MRPIFIIEHLEPKLWRWCLIEYANISRIVGKNYTFFSNIKNKSKYLNKYGCVIEKSAKNLNLQNACLLDPAAKKTLTPKEAKKFSYFIFGGILGDYPQKKRTRKELTPFIKNAAVRNLGKNQLSTDSAVYVTKQIVDGIPLKDIHFQKSAEIPINFFESITLPFYYPLANRKPFISTKLINYLKRRKKQF